MNPNTSNVNGHSVPDGFPTSEEEANTMLLMTFNNDPVKIREAAKESYEKMMKLADGIDGGIKDEVKDEKVELENLEKHVDNVVNVNQQTKVETTVTEKVEKVVDQLTPIAKQTTVFPPPGYLETPEGLYTWSPEIWGGRPLHGVPDRVIEREGRPTMIVFIIVGPAFGRNRNGRVVSLPEGARVVVHAGIAWAPMIGLAKGPEGRPVLWAAPTTVDNVTGKVRIAEPGDKLHIFETGDGGKEYGLSIMYDPDPKNPTIPRLISLETLRGVGG